MNYEGTYSAVHGWLRHQIGTAKPPCEKCGVTTDDRRYEWALLKGKQYQKKRENFFILCRPCHVVYDGVITLLAIKKYKPVVAIKEGKHMKFHSIQEAARITGVSKTSISNNLHGRSKTAGGFVWSIA